MKLESTGIIIGLRPFGERDMVARIFTRDYGVLVGMMPGAAVAKKNRPLAGQVGGVSWNARLDSQLGAFHFESTRNLAAPILSDARALSLLNAAFALIAALLPEREKYEFLYDSTIDLLEHLKVSYLRIDNCPPTIHPLKSTISMGPGASRYALADSPQGGSRGLCDNFESKDVFDCSPPGGSQNAESVLVGGLHHPDRRCTERTLGQAQDLRKEMTHAEKLLWYYLKDSKLGFAFRKQCPIGKYIADFACLEKKLIIELDGSQHGEEFNVDHDIERTKFLNDAGYKIIRFWNGEIFENMDGVLNRISLSLCPPTASRLSPLCDSPQGGSNSSSAITPPLGGVAEPAIAGDAVWGQYESESMQHYLNWEIWLLRELGYALDLTHCSNCGRIDTLTHLSQRTGRAVCAECAAPYVSQCFPMPVDLNATKFFLIRAAATMGATLPPARNMI
ncbi:MAG: DNA repair protein RecO C-terminal domain-containing protein [Proteobacteria bacterium]|nr:DNA repair protein RecO C-terminal domain-containing protein [Pseudomonadota bacterium]